MDKLSTQLKDDAALINAEVSDELDRRIQASLQGVVPEKPREEATSRPVRRRPPQFWWASSLTGIAAALAVIAIVNSQSSPDESAPELAQLSPVAIASTPIIRWQTESAMLARPLQQELEDLQSDLKKAEEKVKQDIGL